jgi:NADP-dependent 3-hydroxy acid dehydrogenase YdfG
VKAYEVDVSDRAHMAEILLAFDEDSCLDILIANAGVLLALML